MNLDLTCTCSHHRRHVARCSAGQLFERDAPGQHVLRHVTHRPAGGERVRAQPRQRVLDAHPSWAPSIPVALFTSWHDRSIRSCSSSTPRSARAAGGRRGRRAAPAHRRRPRPDRVLRPARTAPPPGPPPAPTNSSARPLPWSTSAAPPAPGSTPGSTTHNDRAGAGRTRRAGPGRCGSSRSSRRSRRGSRGQVAGGHDRGPGRLRARHHQHHLPRHLSRRGGVEQEAGRGAGLSIMTSGCAHVPTPSRTIRCER